MKFVTEFQAFQLTKAVQTKTALAAEGKTPEEIQASLGETYKFEGDKLNHFVNAIDVAIANPASLKRVLIISLNEGEVPPVKATKVTDFHYVPEFLVTAMSAKPAADAKGGKGGRPGGRGNKNSGPKGSPWGLSPEEKAAKNGKKGGTAPAKA